MRSWLRAFVTCSLPLLAGCGNAPVRVLSDGTHYDGRAVGDASGWADGGSVCPLPTTVVSLGASPEVALAGDTGSGLGVYDPSVVYPKGAASGALAYSSVSSDSSDGLGHIQTRIATSSDLGASWTYATQPNVASPVTTDTTDSSLCSGTTPCIVSGLLVHEVPSLVLDPTDPDTTRRYKLFVHSYVELPAATPGGGLRFEYPLGYIGLQTAPAPAGPWSSEQKLVGWRSSSSISSMGAAVLLSSIAGLPVDCALATEPGALAGPDGLDLALGCVRPDVGAIDVVLVRSTDHGATFKYVSTLLRGADAPSLCGDVAQWNGADLFLAGGQEYLLASTSGSVLREPAGYSACLAFPLANATRGLVTIGSNGLPTVLRRLVGPGGRFTGPCTYAEGATAMGYLVPEHFLDLAGPRSFRILSSSILAP